MMRSTVLTLAVRRPAPAAPERPLEHTPRVASGVAKGGTHSRLSPVLKEKELMKKTILCATASSVAALCLRCPARADLETGELDRPADVFCAVAEARAEGL